MSRLKRWMKIFPDHVPQSFFSQSSNNFTGKSRGPLNECPIAKEDDIKVDDVIVNSFTDFIQKPNDPLKYKFNEYTNGMKAFLVSSVEEPKEDGLVCPSKEIEIYNMNVYGKKILKGCSCPIPDATIKLAGLEDFSKDTKVYVTICFQVGSFSDPCDFPGMAHFAEHMVFHPHSKRDFDIFLRSHNCEVSNGLTEGNYTLLDYQIEPELLEESLHRFTELFRAPTFSLSSVEKELKVINHEFHLKSKFDGVRLNDFLRVLGIPNHKCTRFSWGNFSSLTKRCIKCLHRELTNFIRRNYTARKMTIIISGSLYFSTMERCLMKLVENGERLESKSEKDEAVKCDCNCSMYPFDTPEFNKICKIIPMIDGNSLHITWELKPKIADDFYSRPINYLATYLSLDQPGTLAHYLTDRFYIFSMDAREGSANFGSTDYGQLFSINYELTEKGVRNYEKILEVTFSYIKYVQSTEPDPEFFKAFFLYNVAKFHLDKPKGVDRIGRLIYENITKKVPIKYMVIGKYFFSQFNPKRIKSSLSELTPESMNVIVISRLFSDECIHTITPFRVKYLMEDISNTLMRRLKRVSILKNFCPFKIPNILTNLFQCELLQIPPQYASLDKSDKVIVKDTTSPKLKYKIKLFSVLSPLSSKPSLAFTAIWKTIFKFRLRATIEMAAFSMINFKIHWKPYLSIKIKGLSQNFLPICSKFIEVMGTMQSKLFEVKEFDFAKEYVYAFYESMLNDSTQRTKLLYKSTSRSTFCSPSEFYISVNELKYQDFCKLNRHFFSELRIVTKFKGRKANKKHSKFLRNLIDQNITYLPLLKKSFEFKPVSTTLYPKGESVLRVLNMHYKDDSTTLTTSIYQVSSCQLQDKLFVIFLSEILSNAMYDYFRIKRQVTYDATSNSSKLMRLDGLPLISIRVTSHWDHKISEIQNLMDNFIRGFYKERLMKMNQNELIELWNGLDFDSIAKGLVVMAPDIAEIQTFYKNYLLPGVSSQMRKLCIQICGGKDIDFSRAVCNGQDVSRHDIGHKAFFNLVDNHKYETLNQTFGVGTIHLVPTDYYKGKYKKLKQEQIFITDFHEFASELETVEVDLNYIGSRSLPPEK